MLHELYEDMDPDYRSRIFLARKKLLSSVESPSLLPLQNLSARKLLNTVQLEKVVDIRKKRLRKVIDRFIAD